MASTQDQEGGPNRDRRESPRPPRRELGITARLGGVELGHLVTVARGPLRLEIEGDSTAVFEAVVFRLDGGPWEPLDDRDSSWHGHLSGDAMEPGFHTIEVLVVAADGRRRNVEATFRVRS